MEQTKQKEKQVLKIDMLADGREGIKKANSNAVKGEIERESNAEIKRKIMRKQYGTKQRT